LLAVTAILLVIWSLFASALCIFLWILLSSVNFLVGDIMSVKKEESVEREHLLKNNQKQFGKCYYQFTANLKWHEINVPLI